MRLYILLVFLLLCPIALAIDTSSQVLYLPFNPIDSSNTSTRDYSSFGSNITVNNANFQNNYYSFNGSNGKYIYANASQVLFNYTNNFSYTLWVRLNSNTTDANGGDYSIIMSSMDGGSHYNYRVDYRNTTNRLTFSLGNATTTNAWYKNPTYSTFINNWVFVSFAYNGTHVYYCMNLDCSTNSFTFNMTPSTRNTYIGSQNDAYTINGSVDDVRIFNKTLTSAEILEIYNYEFNEHNNSCYYDGVGDWTINASDMCSIYDDYNVTGWTNIYGYYGTTTFYGTLRTVAINKVNNYTDSPLQIYLPMIPDTTTTPASYGTLNTKDYITNFTYSAYNFNSSMERVDMSGITFRAANSWLYLGNGSNTLGSKNDTTSFAMSIWYKFDEYPSGTNNTGIMGCYFRYAVQLREAAYTGGMIYGLRNSTTYGAVGTSNGILQKGNWSHIVFNYNATSKNVSLYVNGALVASHISAITNISVGSQSCGIGGAIVGGNGQYTNGTVRDFKLFNKTLTGQEITDLYDGDYNNIYIQKPGQDHNLLYWFGLDNSSALRENTTYFVDKSMYRNNLTCSPSNCPIYKQAVYGQGLYCNYTSPYNVVLGNISQTVRTPFSISMWYSSKQNGSGLSHTIWSMSNAGSYPYLQQRSNDKLLFYAGNEMYLYSTKVFNSTDIDKWYHIVVNVPNNSTVGMEIWINGVNNTGAKGANTGSFIQPGNTLFLCTRTSTPGSEPLNGSIDEVKVYNRTLTVEEINNSYNLGSIKYIYVAPENDPALKIFLPFNKDSSNDSWSKNFVRNNYVFYANPNNYLITNNYLETKNNVSDNFQAYIPNVNLSNSNVGNNFTIAFWISMDNTSAQYSKIFYWGTTNCSIFMEKEDAPPSMDLYFAIRNFTQTSSVLKYVTGSYQPYTWNHMALTVNGDNATSYLNGQYYTSKMIGNVCTNTSTFNFFQSQNMTNMDNFKLYNRSLTSQEVYREYQLGR